MPEYKIKPYEELDITDNFMFCKVFSNEDERRAGRYFDKIGRAHV